MTYTPNRDDIGRFDFGDSRRDDAGQVLNEPTIELPDDVMRVVHGLRSDGLRPMLVGGSVRDALSGATPKDIDFEVYPLDGKSFDVDKLSVSARRFGRVDEVGKSFGVLKMRVGDTDLDLSLPRRDSKSGEGHRGFNISTDTSMTFEEAASRRDFTINAMMYDPATGEFVDPHNGRADWDSRTLRAVSDAFDEDPLRVMRGMQFASRFGMHMDDATITRCRRLRREAKTLPVERMRVEWEKWATKSTEPSAGLRVLHQTGWSSVVPGMSKMAGDERLHDEVDRVAQDSDEHKLDRRVMLGATLARRMTREDAVAFLDQSIEGVRAQRRAFDLSRSATLPLDDADLRLAAHGPVTLRERAVSHDARRGVLNRAIDLGVADRPEPDLLNGNDIMDVTGRKPGPWLKDVLTVAREAQARREFDSRGESIEWLRASTQPLGLPNSSH